MELDMFTKIKQALNSESGRVLAVNFVSLSILQVVGFVFPLLTMPYLARTIGLDGFGKIAFGVSVIAYFQTMVDWGFKFTAVRDIAKHKNDCSYVSNMVSQIISAKILLMLLSALVLELLILYIPIFSSHKSILWATFCMIPGYILFPDWLFQGMEQMKYITIMNFFSKLCFTVLVFVLIRDKDDFLLEPILTSIGYFLSGIVAFVYAIKTFKLRLKAPKYKNVKGILLSGWNIFLTQFVPTLYNNLSVILLNTFSGQAATGIFSSGYKFINISEQFSGVLSRTFFPFLARRMDKHSLYVRLSGCFSVFMGIFLFVFADLLIKIFFTEEFSDAIVVLRIMSIAPFFLFLMNAYGTNGLMLIGHESTLRKIIVYCSLIGLVLALILVYYYSYIGTAITIVSVWGIRGLFTMYYAKKYNVK